MNRKHAQFGVTLIELIIALAIFGALLVMAAQSFSGWIRNSRVRTTAESIQNGLQLARAEAVRRNTFVRFQLTSTTDNTCQVNATSVNWVISLADPTNLCATPPSDTVAPQIIQSRSAAEGSRSTTVAGTEWNMNAIPIAVATTPVFSGWVTFNGFGRVLATTTPATPGSATIGVGNTILFDVAYPGDTCAVLGGNVRCLRVVVSSGGEIRMCDPNLPTTDGQAC